MSRRARLAVPSPGLSRAAPPPTQLSLGTVTPPPWLSEPVELTASVAELLSGVPAALVCSAYAARKHWLANNALGLAFSLQGVELISLGSAQVGALLLAGLFVYDVFWVFCTPVMVSVAMSFDAPIKLLFPRPKGAGSLAAAAASAAASSAANATASALLGAASPPVPKPERPFNMLGLGDVVIPGIFVAIVLRMDMSRAAAARAAGAPPPPAYFPLVLASYVLGLGTTIGVMNVFNAAQPARCVVS